MSEKLPNTHPEGLPAETSKKEVKYESKNEGWNQLSPYQIELAAVGAAAEVRARKVSGLQDDIAGLEKKLKKLEMSLISKDDSAAEEIREQIREKENTIKLIEENRDFKETSLEKIEKRKLHKARARLGLEEAPFQGDTEGVSVSEKVVPQEEVLVSRTINGEKEVDTTSGSTEKVATLSQDPHEAKETLRGLIEQYEREHAAAMQVIAEEANPKPEGSISVESLQTHSVPQTETLTHRQKIEKEYREKYQAFHSDYNFLQRLDKRLDKSKFAYKGIGPMEQLEKEYLKALAAEGDPNPRKSLKKIQEEIAGHSKSKSGKNKNPKMSPKTTGLTSAATGEINPQLQKVSDGQESILMSGRKPEGVTTKKTRKDRLLLGNIIAAAIAALGIVGDGESTHQQASPAVAQRSIPPKSAPKVATLVVSASKPAKQHEWKATVPKSQIHAHLGERQSVSHSEAVPTPESNLGGIPSGIDLDGPEAVAYLEKHFNPDPVYPSAESPTTKASVPEISLPVKPLSGEPYSYNNAEGIRIDSSKPQAFSIDGHMIIWGGKDETEEDLQARLDMLAAEFEKKNDPNAVGYVEHARKNPNTGVMENFLYEVHANGQMHLYAPGDYPFAVDPNKFKLFN